MQAKPTLRRPDDPGFGAAFLGIAAILYGIPFFLQGDFTDFWQPVPKGLPFREPLAYLSASVLVLGGSGLLVARTIRPAAILLLSLFAVFDVCYLLRLIGPPLDPFSLMGLAEQSAVVVGAWIILLRTGAGVSSGATTARIVFGISSLIFGLAHFIARVPTASMVPEWIPGGQMFWALATGVGHVAVGLALITNRVAVLATRLGVLMYSCFVLFSHLPGAFTHPTQWLRWEGAAFSLCMAAGLWLVGDMLAASKGRTGSMGAQADDVDGGALQSA